MTVEEALTEVNINMVNLVHAVRFTMSPTISMMFSDQNDHIEKNQDRGGYRDPWYWVDQWEVGPYARWQNGKRVHVRGYTATPSITRRHNDPVVEDNVIS